MSLSLNSSTSLLCHKLDLSGKIIKSFYININKTSNPDRFKLLSDKVIDLYENKCFDNLFLIKNNDYYYTILNNKYIKNNIVDVNNLYIKPIK